MVALPVSAITGLLAFGLIALFLPVHTYLFCLCLVASLSSLFNGKWNYILEMIQ